MQLKPQWRQREDALLLGAPLVVVPALSFVPLILSLLLNPGFSHARALGFVLLPLFFLLEWVGLTRLATAYRSQLDAISFFAAGTAIMLWVIAGCSGVLLAVVLSRS